jgi:predicted metal-dependent enzyme (double-stranded beta helix superfamily)
MNRPAALGFQPLIGRLDRAVELGATAAVAGRIKSDLSEIIHARAIDLPERYRQPRLDCYARRLLHLDPERRYSVVVMTWGPGQGTPLHDHGDTWCVEAVVDGEMDVTQFVLVQDRGQLCRFEQRSRVRSLVGSSGYLIPPFQYHILRNALPDRTSITLHVYGGEMRRCFIFEPRDDGWHERREKALHYHD